MPLGVTQEMIDEWKRLYKGVSLITVRKKLEVGRQKSEDGSQKPEDGSPEFETKEYYGYFRKPNLMIIAAAGKYSDTEPIKSGEVLFDNCKLQIDPELQNDDELKMSVIIRLNGLFEMHETEVKNL